VGAPSGVPVGASSGVAGREPDPGAPAAGEQLSLL
jgi:hypothetical protein